MWLLEVCRIFRGPVNFGIFLFQHCCENSIHTTAHKIKHVTNLMGTCCQMYLFYSQMKSGHWEDYLTLHTDCLLFFNEHATPDWKINKINQPNRPNQAWIDNWDILNLSKYISILMVPYNLIFPINYNFFNPEKSHNKIPSKKVMSHIKRILPW